jgi:hypothetical protein
VEQQRHRRLVDEGARVPPLRAAHDELADAERRARDARQVLHDAKRVSIRPGDEANLFLLQGDLRDLFALARRAHHRLVAAVHLLANEVGHLGALAGHEAFGRLELRVAGEQHDDLVLARGHVAHLEPPVCAGDGLDDGVAFSDDDLRGLERVSRAALAHEAREVHQACRAGVWRDRHLDDLLPEEELVRELNAHGRGLAVDLCGGEAELANRRQRLAVERLARAPHDARVHHRAVGPDVDLHHHGAADARVEQLGRERRLDLVNERRRLREHAAPPIALGERREREQQREEHGDAHGGALSNANAATLHDD